MNIDSVMVVPKDIPLTRPYTIAFETYDSVRLILVAIRAGDCVGLGSASPAVDITGETPAACHGALSPGRLSWLTGRDIRHLRALNRELRTRLHATPAACAAIDMALHDLYAQRLGLPLVEVLGRCHDALPTSITIGIKESVAEILEEADEYLARGFRALKVKIGHDVDLDLQRLQQLRSHIGDTIALRVDANQGYDVAATSRFLTAAAQLNLELVEQPLPADALHGCRALEDRDAICLDESVHTAADAARALFPRAAGSLNIKLMKSGGIAEARRIADLADLTSTDLMWGCMDESRVSIAAALHAALACPATRWLDLDGHLDLASDPFEGGFSLENGVLRTLDEPGLGVREAVT